MIVSDGDASVVALVGVAGIMSVASSLRCLHLCCVHILN